MALWYVALGDSVAVGYRAAPGQEYVSRIYRHLWQANPEWRFAKVARAGAVTADLPGQVAVALAYRPALITLDIGGNDLRRAFPTPGRIIPYSMRNLDRALGTLRSRSAAPIFVADVYNPAPAGSDYREWAGEHVGAFNRELGRVVARHGCILVPISSALARASYPVFAPDRLHPNTAGHAVIAETFLRSGAGHLAGR